MQHATKTNILQTYQVVVYDRALHPELFELKGRCVIQHDGYELESWITPGGHVLRFEADTGCVSELLTSQVGGLPDKGVVEAFPCAGERDFEHSFAPCKINYLTTVQTEQLSENLYLSTLEELTEHARDVEAVSHHWRDDTGECLSMLDIQRFSSEIHAQSYHLIAQGGLVLRTQTIFELTKPKTD